MIRLLPIDAASYVPHDLHAADRVWVETNCYVDLWIELLHALGRDCTPALAFTLAVDFEGDQWRFFKFPLEDLRALYGIDVGEMNAWRALDVHVEEQLLMGRLLTTEVDAWYLPDTAGVSYHSAHVKTAIVPNMIDREHGRLGYFHNAGYHELEGEDFADIFSRAADRRELLPPYVELVKVDGMQRLGESEVLAAAVSLARRYVARRPPTNPVQRFRKRLEQDVDWLRAEGLDTFHEYAFATLRQFGSSSELAASFCGWLAQRGEPLVEVELQLRELASLAKTAQFQLARIVSGRNIDIGPVLDPMEHGWDTAMQSLVECYA